MTTYRQPRPPLDKLVCRLLFLKPFVREGRVRRETFLLLFLLLLLLLFCRPRLRLPFREGGKRKTEVDSGRASRNSPAASRRVNFVHVFFTSSPAQRGERHLRFFFFFGGGEEGGRKKGKEKHINSVCCETLLLCKKIFTVSFGPFPSLLVLSHFSDEKKKWRMLSWPCCTSHNTHLL